MTDRPSPLNADSLRKILDLESKKGYLDSAVIGGLDAFLRNWSAPAVESLTSPKLMRQFKKLKLDKSGYASMTKEQRKQWLETVLIFLDSVNNQPLIPNPQSLAPTPRPPKPRRSVKTVILHNVAAGSLNSPITIVRGISEIMAKKFARLGVKTVRDLLYFFPARHFDYSQRKTISQLTEGKETTIVANVWESRIKMGWLGKRPSRSTEATVGDETGNVRVVWFNNPYVVKSLPVNARIMLSGRVGLFNGQHVFQSPEWEPLEDKELIHTGRLVPLYHLTAGLGSRQVRKLVKAVVDEWSVQVQDFLPPELRDRRQLLGLSQALSQAHFPEDETFRDRARVRLAFDELLLLQLGVLAKKRDWQESQPGHPFTINQTVLSNFIKSLPFVLTAAQNRVLKELLADLEKGQPMSRLLQGEVGSGKTVVAAAALLMAVVNGYQGALMAPTEILAGQHFSTISQLFSRVSPFSKGGLEGDLRNLSEVPNLCVYSGILPRPITVAVLTGDIAAAKKRQLQKLIKNGDIDIIIGTHALIQKDVGFHKLGLAVVDEQHRFGVTQRSALRQQGFNPHMLVMTATPIPRTLALTLFGDLDLSVIDELPPGRQVVKTKWLKPEQRESAYAFIRKQVAAGRQAFIICPLVEESEAVQAKAAVAEYERLSSQVFHELRLGLLHGRMSSEEKDGVMKAFYSGELNILVATPVVEVGIDVPNATVMLVESADRFGLSQLHQFRGRVGRGKEQSYCMLLSENPSEEGQERLKVIEGVYDGFKLAEEDLKLRGPGEFFGTRQSGLPDLRMAKLSDVHILELARTEATRLFSEDPKLKKPEHALLVKELSRVWPDFEAGEWS
ncbi:MAG: ATP-dependent DNA helicase RecG [Dehalococcoidales bacterium]|nr:ATP-dependent DNA helicase RecG [Dehalococcoidales bacterium]